MDSVSEDPKKEIELIPLPANRSRHSVYSINDDDVVKLKDSGNGEGRKAKPSLSTLEFLWFVGKSFTTDVHDHEVVNERTALQPAADLHRISYDGNTVRAQLAKNESILQVGEWEVFISELLQRLPSFKTSQFRSNF